MTFSAFVRINGILEIEFEFWPFEVTASFNERLLNDVNDPRNQACEPIVYSHYATILTSRKSLGCETNLINIAISALILTIDPIFNNSASYCNFYIIKYFVFLN